ncbi:DUF2079 domain-containing protein [Streptomyces sp. B1866]|uniref:DUF2079 domain-containing protein n=1 Tax=Streptomyces sp. B1866 TaxID=3075431 RepID=UPI00288CE69A|nr:DUF2079 domain-containing protein [Streptomyces sp. B1866]MDT3398925.1 DUF2079 domain-containing protein [Streptomyces sp. B1866]
MAVWRARLRAGAAALGRPGLDPYWLAAGFFAAFSALSVCLYRRMFAMSWDLGIFEQAIRSYAHLREPVADLKGPGTNILGDHFSPITALVAPFYRLYPGAVTLLVVQAGLFALSVVPVTRVAALLLGRWRGLAVGIGYGLSWGLQRAVEFDFHEICFAVPLLAFALEAIIRERWTAAMLWAVPLVFVKEDMGATVAAVGAVITLRTWRSGDARVVPRALGLVVFGVLALVFTLRFAIPHFNATGAYDYWNKVDGSGEATATVPVETALRTTLWILLPTTGLLALRSPLLLVAAPTLGWRFVSHEEHYWGTAWHYSAVLMPVVFLALVDACARLRESRFDRLRRYARQAPMGVAAAGLALTTALPLEQLTDPDFYRKPAQVTAAERALNRIPDGASVEANVPPISRLTNRCRVFWVTGAKDVVPDYIALSESADYSQDRLVSYARVLHPSARYEFLAEGGGVWIAKRVSPGG